MHIRKLESFEKTLPESSVELEDETTDDIEIRDKGVTKSLTTKLDEELLNRIKDLVEESHKTLDKPASNQN